MSTASRGNRSPRTAPASGRAPAGVHGAGGVCDAGGAAADAQRQARSQGAARAGGLRLAAGYLAPSTPEEILLCELVAELLGLERVGLADNFFHLGGDSISSIRLVSRARERGLSSHPGMCSSIPFWATSHSPHAAAPPSCRTSSPTSPKDRCQRPRLFAGSLHKTIRGRTSIKRCCCRPPHKLDETALIAALQALLDHHDVLRLRVSQDGGLLIPLAGAVRASSCLQRISLAGLAAAQRQEHCAAPSRTAQAASTLMQAKSCRPSGRTPSKTNPAGCS